VPPIFEPGRNYHEHPSIICGVKSSQVVFSCLFRVILFHQNAFFTLTLTKKLQLQLLGDFVSQTPYRGSAPGSRWGTSVP